MGATDLKFYQIYKKKKYDLKYPIIIESQRKILTYSIFNNLKKLYFILIE